MAVADEEDTEEAGVSVDEEEGVTEGIDDKSHNNNNIQKNF